MPERDQMAERERSRLQRLNMTGTDERCSRSRSGTPSQADNFVPQPVFLSHPGGHSHSGSIQLLQSSNTSLAQASHSLWHLFLLNHQLTLWQV